MRHTRSHYDRDRRGYEAMNPNTRRGSMSGRGGGGRGGTSRYEYDDENYSHRSYEDDYDYDSGAGSGPYGRSEGRGGRGFASMEEDRHRAGTARSRRHSGNEWDNRYENEGQGYDRERYENENISGRYHDEADERGEDIRGFSSRGSREGQGFSGTDREHFHEIAGRGRRTARRYGAADSREASQTGRLRGRSRRF